MIDMPAAGGFSDGEISFTSSYNKSNLRNTLSFQALPRVFGAFRYSGIGDQERLYYNSSGYTTWDRSFDFRIDFLKESALLPDFTVGFQDVFGTGIYSSEYLVASKSILPNFRSTVGVGWGRLGTKNIISNLGSRNNQTGGNEGGLLRLNSFFRGSYGIFGGVEYKIKKPNLTIKVELSSDSYEDENLFKKNIQKSDINYGLHYPISEVLDISAYQKNGNETGLQFNLNLNPNTYGISSYLEETPQPFYSSPIKINNKSEYIKKITSELEKERIVFVGYSERDNEAILIIENNHFSSNTQAVGRTLRIMSRFVPKEKNTFTVILTMKDIPVTSISGNRNKIAEIADAPNSELLTKQLIHITSAKKQIEEVFYKNKPAHNINWKIKPYYRLHLFDPEKPIYHDLGASLNLSYTPKPGFILSSVVQKPIISDFDEIWRGEKGALPKVRTRLKNYLNNQQTRIKDFYGASYFKLSDDIYGRLTGGFLESMYAGFSSEILYHRSDSKVSFGAELNHVKARDFRQLFGTENLDGLSKTNGHLSAYWDTNYYYYNAQLDVGKYLAGDNGGTLTLSRDFPNGWKVGGFFTLTNTSFEQFGEGSFDKGIFFRLPINPIIPYETKSSVYEEIKPIQGDGGQRVKIPGRLYELTKDKRKNALNNSWYRLWR